MEQLATLVVAGDDAIGNFLLWWLKNICAPHLAGDNTIEDTSGLNAQFLLGNQSIAKVLEI